VTAWILLGLVVALTGFLVRPLLGGASGTRAARGRLERGRLRDLVSAREMAYAALKEIEFDRLTHKLDEQDYRTLHARYRAQAAALMKKIDELQPGPASPPPGRERGTASA
jgi:hypothetical protein